VTEAANAGGEEDTMTHGKDAEARRQLYRDKGWWYGATMHGAFDDAADAAPDRTAIVDPLDCEALIGRDGLRLTWREARNASVNLAHTLSDTGIGKGDAVLVQLPNTAELTVLYIALSRLGAVISPIAMQYGRHEVGHTSRTLSAKAFIGAASFKGEPSAARVKDALPEGTPVFTFGDVDGGAFVLDLDPSEPAAAAPDAGEGEDIVTICWTSGTTGTPKGVPRHHGHWFAQALAVEDAVPLPEGSAMLNPFPLINMAALAGFFIYWMRNRGTLVLHHPFDLQAFLKQLVIEKIAYTIAPPAVLNMFLQNEALHGQVDLSAVKYIASGSAPLDPWMTKGFKDKFGIEIINFFGSNEGIGLVGGPAEVPDSEQRAVVFPRFGAKGLSWSNRFADFFESKLVDWRGADAVIEEPGKVGELLIRGPNVFEGYLGGKDDEVFDADGFFRTGDLFEIAGEAEMSRFYRFKGRRKDVIIRGGVNISPEELDGVLNAHPAIAEAAVCGYDDRMMGEKVCLFAVVKQGESLDLASVSVFLEAQGVAKFKWPERLELVDALPRNPLNKVVRPELKKRLEQA
jgi:acyl-CoA synthetase (AMP-forming)/AMP-acid ligase II